MPYIPTIDGLHNWFPATINDLYRRLEVRLAQETQRMYTQQRAILEESAWGRELIDGHRLLTTLLHSDGTTPYCEIHEHDFEDSVPLLPDIDWLWLFKDGGGDLWISLADFQSHCPGVLEFDMRFAPVRYRMNRWPTDEEWAKM